MLLKAIDKILQILNAQSVRQLKSLLAVSFGFGKARIMFCLSSLLFGFDGPFFFLPWDLAGVVYLLYPRTLVEPRLWVATLMKSGSWAGESSFFPHNLL
jgi:hypothetical protein